MTKYTIVPEIVAGRHKFSVYKDTPKGRAYVGSFETERAAEEAISWITRVGAYLREGKP